MKSEKKSEMKIQWKFIYYPLGEWISEDGSIVPSMDSNFRAIYNGKEILVIYASANSGVSHGESNINSAIPVFIDADTLEQIIMEGWIEVK